MRAVLITPVIPAATGNGLSMRAGLWLEALAGAFETDVTVARIFPEHETAAAFTGSLARSVTMLGGTLGTDPMLPRPAPTLDQPSRDALRELIDSADVVVVFRLYLAGLAEAAAELGVPVVVDLDDLDWVREARLGQHSEAQAYRRLAGSVLASATVATTASADDAGIGPRIHEHPTWLHVPNGVRAPLTTSLVTERDIDLLFVATLGYEPNAQGALWLVREVLPRLPGATVALVGAAPPPVVRDLAGPGVIVAHDVPDVSPWYQRSRVCVVPIHAGAGTRTKIPEAWAHGRPIVSTTLGAEGLHADDLVLLADDAASFADACSRLLADPQLAGDLAAAGGNRFRAAHEHGVAVAAATAAVHAALEGAGRTPANRVRP